ncbi:uncharacterized protein METZ01_LOCUS512352 [marine metagenome]|uniref:Uncharacterized protein n=1 Tax=marine metagenome TaxID=408172 RepID=A0A383ETW1_9ZZZZ
MREVMSVPSAQAAVNAAVDRTNC